MQKLIAIIFGLLSLFTEFKAFGRTDEFLTKITITISKDDMPIDANNTVSIICSEYPFVGSEFMNTPTQKIEKIYTIGKKLSFDIRSEQAELYFIIGYKWTENQTKWTSTIEQPFMIKSGSNINCEINKGEFTFTGDLSNSLNVQSSLSKITYSESDSDLKLFNDYKVNSFIDKQIFSLDSCLRAQLKLLDNNRDALNNSEYNLLKSNCIALKYYRLYYSLSFYTQTSLKYHQLIKNYFFKSEPSVDSLNDQLLDIYAPALSNAIFEKIIFFTRIRSENWPPVFKTIQLKTIYNQIVTEYDGYIRDKLLTLFYIRYSLNSNFDIVENGVLTSIESPFYRKFVVDRHDKNKTGSTFRDFALQDTSGRTTTLADFRNKVIVMDFWYTGCVNCVKLTSAMQPVYNHFAQNKNVTFVSISIDKDKKKWINSIKKHIYSHKGSVDLYTNGQGETNDLIKYYNIRGYPNLKIISNGILYESNMTFAPKDGVNIDRSSIENDIIKRIEIAIEKLDHSSNKKLSH